MDSNQTGTPRGTGGGAESGRYGAADLAFIVPTKDRPAQLEKMLESLAKQSEMCGCIVVVDGGKSIEDVVAGFRASLNIRYLQSAIPGQIRQRCMGIDLLGTKYPLVGFLDDDLVLENDAVERMIRFWNRVEENTAGIGFNITNAPPFSHSPGRAIFFMSAPSPGKVLKSGYNVSIANISADTRTQWLGGGYTVWRSMILREFPQDPLNTRWAIGEDLRFSFPIGKKYPLYVCAGARVRHEHVFDQAPPGRVHYYRGRKSVVSQFYFVQLHEEDFSYGKCLWMLFGKCVSRLIEACARRERSSIVYAVGELSGFFTCLRAALRSENLRRELED